MIIAIDGYEANVDKRVGIGRYAYEILKSLGVDKESAVMVGDAVTDMEMGMNAGLRASIGVCSGLTAKKELVAKTQYIVEDISRIKVI